MSRCRVASVEDFHTGSEGGGPAALFVLLTWAVTFAVGLGFILRFGSEIPLRDDGVKVEYLARQGQVSLEWLWKQEAEHRMPLSRLVWWLTFRGTVGDLRASMVSGYIALSGMTFVLLLGVRRLRGSWRYWDAVIPLAFLHLGHADNLLWFHQPGPVFRAGAYGVLICYLWNPKWQTSLGMTVLASTLFLLNCVQGMSGVVYSSVFAIGLLSIASGQRSSDRDGGRACSIVLVASLSLWVALTTLYFIGFESGQQLSPQEPDAVSAIIAAIQTLTMALGPVAKRIWPLSGALMLLAVTASIAAIFANYFIGSKDGRASLVARLTTIGAPLLLAGAIGWGRQDQGGLLDRYSLYILPVVAAIWCTWTVLGPRKLMEFAQVCLFSFFCAASLFHAAYGVDIGQDRITKTNAFFQYIMPRIQMTGIVGRHTPYWGINEERFRRVLQTLRDGGFGRFTEITGDPPMEVIDVPIEQADSHSLFQSEANTWSGEGHASSFVWDLKQPQHVLAVVIRYTLHSRRNSTQMRIAWRPADATDSFDGVESQTWTINFNPNKKRHEEVQTFWIDERIQAIAFHPCAEQFEIEVHEVSLLVPTSASMDPEIEPALPQ